MINLRVMVKPLINWIWIGSGFMAIGTLMVIGAVLKPKQKAGVQSAEAAMIVTKWILLAVCLLLIVVPLLCRGNKIWKVARVRYAFVTLVLAVFSVGVLTGQEAAQEVRPPHDFATVTVRLHNATAGGTDVAGDSVTLTLYANGRPVDARQAKADAEGAAVFENVVTGDGLVAAVHARHGDMSFSSGEPVVLEAGKKKFETTVHVYEVSEDNSQLKVGAHHFILRAEGSRLVVTEIMQLINPTDRAISSATKDADGKPQVIRINLPAGWGNFMPPNTS